MIMKPYKAKIIFLKILSNLDDALYYNQHFKFLKLRFNYYN